MFIIYGWQIVLITIFNNFEITGYSSNWTRKQRRGKFPGCAPI